MLWVVLLLGGLALVIFGADLLVRGASGLARRLGVSPLAIGMTVVAFGTSIPEIAINTLSAASGKTDLAFGNIVGSCLANIGFVLAISAMVRPLRVPLSVITREVPMLMLSATALLVLCADRFLKTGNSDVLTRQDGVILLLLFGVFIYYSSVSLLSARNAQEFMAEVEETYPQEKERLLSDFVRLGLGLVATIGGARLAVNGAVGIAEKLGVPDLIIGLTIVSLGTTLPELATGITAARRGASDIAVGNVVGSCILNILLIGGMVAVIYPVLLPAGGLADLLMLCVFGIALLPICLRGPNLVTRAEGALLLLAYLGYLSWRGIQLADF